MTDNLQLQTSRLDNTDAGNHIDDSLADIEHCLRVIFNITADTPISQVMSIVAAGNVTMVGDITLSGAPANVLHCATKKYVDDNATGVGGAYKCKVLSAANTILSGNTGIIEWASAAVEDGDSGQWTSGDPTKVICKSAGDYLIGFEVHLDYAGILASGSFYVDLLINGATVIDNIVGKYTKRGGSLTYSSGGVLYTLAENDYIQLNIYNPEANSLSIPATSDWFGTQMWFIKVG